MIGMPHLVFSNLKDFLATGPILSGLPDVT
jgi:hypothetical protein